MKSSWIRLVIACCVLVMVVLCWGTVPPCFGSDMARGTGTEKGDPVDFVDTNIGGGMHCPGMIIGNWPEGAGVQFLRWCRGDVWGECTPNTTPSGGNSFKAQRGASIWGAERKPWTIISGDEESGI